jgi:ring-1,2-phenylacetyl-CoA epoxidase subunit PaaE
MFWDELERLRGQYGERLAIQNVWSREQHHYGRQPARLHAERLRALIEQEIAGPPIDRWIMCGPTALMDTVSATLRAHGVDDEHIHQELFTAAGTEPLHDGHDRPLLDSDVTVVLDGRETRLALSSHGDSILAATLALRPEAPYSCSDGVCATCRAKVVEGAVEMTRCSALDRREIEDGYVLTCQAHPLTERVVVDFDA